MVAPRVAQIADRLTDGVEAVLVPPGDVAALATALEQLRDDPGLRSRLSAMAQSAASQWSWDHQVERILAALA